MNIIFGFIFIILGLLNVCIPEKMIRLANWWRFRDFEPTDLYLSLTIIGGLITIILGILLLIDPEFVDVLFDLKS